MDKGYNVIDTFGNHSLGYYQTRDDALRAIRFYILDKMFSKVGLFEQDFINLSEDGNVVIYENPIGYFPTKPKFLLEEIDNFNEVANNVYGLK
tara:strand:- start:777 stop:1055 length:279 start_codon:yes stop_codon:yes gene_type:complete